MTRSGRTVFLFVFLLLLVRVVTGQQLSVFVKDLNTGKPVSFAHVCIEDLDNGEKHHFLSDESGAALCDIKGVSVLSVTFVGYENYFDTIQPGKDVIVQLKPSIFNLQDVVVTAQYTPQKADNSIYKVNVINSRVIDQKAAVNLSDLLASELSIKFTHDAALGSGIELLGLGGEHVKYLIDGVPVLGRLNGNIDISQLNLYNVDHIEVIEGPMSVVYGSNALAGVINIITKENQSAKLRANAGTYFESVGIANVDGAFSYFQNNQSVSVNLARNYFSGYDLVDTTRMQTFKPKIQYIADAHYLYSGKNTKLKLAGDYFHENLWAKGNLLAPYHETAFDNYFKTQRYGIKADYNQKLNAKRFLNLLLSYSDYQRRQEKYFKDLTTLDKVHIGDVLTRFSNIVARGIFSKSTNEHPMNYQLGVDINAESGEGERIKDQKQFMGDYAAFLSVKYQLSPALKIQPGLRYIYNTRYDAPLVYSINVQYRTEKHWNFRASYAKGFRAPSLKELYLDFVDANHDIQGNDQLKALYSHSLNGHVEYISQYKDNPVKLEAKLFHNDIRNNIMLARSDPYSLTSYSYVNVGRYFTTGGQFNVSYSIYPEFNLQLGVSETGSRVVPSEDFEGEMDYVWSADFIANASYRIIKYDIDFSLNYKYVGATPEIFVGDDDEVLVGEIEAYHHMDFRVAKSFFESKLKVAAGIKNIFDNTLVSASGTGAGAHSGGSGATPIGWGRTAFVKLTYDFNRY